MSLPMEGPGRGSSLLVWLTSHLLYIGDNGSRGEAIKEVSIQTLEEFAEKGRDSTPIWEWVCPRTSHLLIRRARDWVFDKLLNKYLCGQT